MLIRSITQNAMDNKFSIRQFPSSEHPYVAFPQKNLAVLDISRFTTEEIGPQSRLKLFTKIITTRLEKKLDENQPREQAGFRSKYSTTDHIHAINQPKEQCREYNIPLCVAFVDYEKAFDSVQTQAILTSLQEQGIEDVYIEILKDIYTDSSVTVHLHKESEKIRIKRGVRQGDTISPKLFTATLESIFRRLNWENKGMKIDGEFLSNLRFADDIFLCTETPQELQQMLQEPSDESRRMGLKMNIAKTKAVADQ